MSTPRAPGPWSGPRLLGWWDGRPPPSPKVLGRGLGFQRVPWPGGEQPGARAAAGDPGGGSAGLQVTRPAGELAQVRERRVGGTDLPAAVSQPGGVDPESEAAALTAPPPPQSHIKKRLFLFRFGDRGTRMNWVHVRNLVQAHVLAAEALTAARGYVAVSAPRAARRSPSLAHAWLTGVSPQLRMAGRQDCGPRDTWGG